MAVAMAAVLVFNFIKPWRAPLLDPDAKYPAAQQTRPRGQIHGHIGQADDTPAGPH